MPHTFSPVQFDGVHDIDWIQLIMTKPICLWSGPRNVSTALMYSFAQLSSVRVIDEPLYGHYLRVSGADHPGREDVMDAMECDGNAVMNDLLRHQAQDSSRTLFAKHLQPGTI